MRPDKKALTPDEKAQIRAQFSDIERKSVTPKERNKKGDNASKDDLLNVLAGHNTFTDRPERAREMKDPLPNPNDDEHMLAEIPTAELEIRTALPRANPNPPGDADLQHASSHIIARQGEEYYLDLLQQSLGAEIANKAKNLNISNHKEAATLIQQIKTGEKGQNPASTNTQKLLKYLVYKAKVGIDRTDPGIQADHSSREITEKIRLRNQQFQQQMQQDKTAINTILQNEYGLTIKNPGVEQATDHVCRVDVEAAKLETDFRAEKQLLLEHTAQTVNLLESTRKIDGEGGKLEKLVADKQKVERERETVFKEFAENSDERAALKWTAQEMRLQEKYNRNPNQKNEQAITDHRKNRPELLNNTAAISAQLEKVREIQPRINRIERQQQRLKAGRPAVELVERDRKLLPQLQQQLEEEKRQFLVVTSPGFNEKDLNFYLEHRRLNKLNEQNNTEDNQNKARDFQEDYGNDMEDEIPLGDPAIPGATDHRDKMYRLVDEFAFHQAKNQQVKNIDTVRASPDYQIAQAQMDYQADLELAHTMAANTENPHADGLRGAHHVAKAAHDTYVAKVQEVHKASGTEDILKDVSAPLKALRENKDVTPQEASANPMSTGASIFLGVGALPFAYKGLAYLGGLVKDKAKDTFFPSQEAETTQLPALDITKFHPAEGVPRPDCLAAIINQTQEVNKLLKEREELEATVAAHPNMARDMVPEIKKNTDKLHEAMTELLENAVATDDAGLFVTYEDQKAKEAWVRKLQAATRGVEAASYKSLPTAAKTDAQKSTAQVQRNKNSAKHLNTKRKTTYSEALKDGKFRDVNLKAKIKQKDGTEKMEDVEFTNQELDAELKKFCKEKELKVNHVGDKKGIGFISNNTVRKQCNSNGDTKFRWPSQQLKNDWLKHLSSAYTAKRELEITKKDNAPENVSVSANREEHDEAAAIHANAP